MAGLPPNPPVSVTVAPELIVRSGPAFKGGRCPTNTGWKTACAAPAGFHASTTTVVGPTSSKQTSPGTRALEVAGFPPGKVHSTESASKKVPVKNAQSPAHTVSGAAMEICGRHSGVATTLITFSNVRVLSAPFGRMALSDTENEPGLS